MPTGSEALDRTTTSQAESITSSAVAGVGGTPTEVRKAHRKVKASWSRPTASPHITTPLENIKAFQLTESHSQNMLSTNGGTISTRPNGLGIRQAALSSGAGGVSSGTASAASLATTSTGPSTPPVSVSGVPMNTLTSSPAVVRSALSPGKTQKFLNRKMSRQSNGAMDAGSMTISARAMTTPQQRPSASSLPDRDGATSAAPHGSGIITLPPIAGTPSDMFDTPALPGAKSSGQLQRLKLDMHVIESTEEQPSSLESGRDGSVTGSQSADTEVSQLLGMTNMSMVDYLNAEGQLCGSWQSFIYPVEAVSRWMFIIHGVCCDRNTSVFFLVCSDGDGTKAHVKSLHAIHAQQAAEHVSDLLTTCCDFLRFTEFGFELL